MTSLAEFLYPLPARRSVSGILSWWERRRPAYNAFVGGAGIFTVLVVVTLQALPPFSEFTLPPWQVILAYGVGANVMYSFGASIEILAEKIWGEEVRPVGPVLYRMGLTFAVGLTLFPALLMSIIWVVAVVLSVLPIA